MIRQQVFYLAIAFARDLQAAFVDNRNFKDLRTLIETTEENRLALLNHGHPVDPKDILVVFVSDGMTYH